MRNLFYAALFRGKNKSLLFKELAIAVFLSVFLILNGYFQTNLTNAYIYKLIARFFGYAPFAGFFTAVFSAHLWGADYEYGTIRNKLICGHTRESLYLSNLLLTTCAGLLVTLAWLLINGTLGIALLGRASLTLSTRELLVLILTSMLMVFSFSSIFCLLASMTANRTFSLLICLAAAAAMILVGMLLYNPFSEPEYSSGWMWLADKPAERWHPKNLQYISGPRRTLLEFLICLTPGGQSVILCEEGAEHLIFLPLCSCLVTLISSLTGILCFRKKDIK